ncbi:flagellar hook-length control protein FliK [Ralstonia insidiosa]|uniref:Flagellar hook-length control protein FliK n=1 Tax=Ralstonia insidiosa TaxID=190721 RepID=A0A848NMX2_9RALS|nr:flagellar hook-length control protein FliK [Ralstonia insidiosa]NMV36311.1 flagellar hook-length control protein FliK [Ralstonia insidiosa]
MMMGLLAAGNLASNVALGSNTAWPAEATVLQQGPLGDFEHLLAGDIAMTEGLDIADDSFAELDASVALALVQALETETPADIMPALQDGVMVAPWLMQALDVREADATAADDAADMPTQPGASQVLGQARPAGQPAMQTAQMNMFGRSAIALAAAPQANAQDAVAPALADRMFNRPQGTAPAATALNEVATAAPAQALNTRAAGESPLPTGIPAMTFDGPVRASTAQADLPAASAAPRAPTEPQQKLIDALGDRLSVQTAQGMRHAVIRLDPHLNGSVRIELRQDANGIAVHLSATNADVVRQLQAIGESLRQDLSARNGGDVTVQVSASRQGHADADTSGGRERHARDDAEQGPGRGLAAAGGDGAFEFVSRDAARTQKETV